MSNDFLSHHQCLESWCCSFFCSFLALLIGLQFPTQFKAAEDQSDWE